ncbi:methionyl-tRNA formyltransferase [Salinithrix halophila]|uniref:Methionyl-tRNA formyltransferase n=1 Tax=Salinithrix halophila TaxID=1485204 RepID=A0ABV8JC17_9BACL
MASKTRVVFMGTPDFAVPSLRALVDAGLDVAAVVTQPDRPRGRKRELTPPPVKRAALEMGMDVLQPEKLWQSTALGKILTVEPDLVVTAAYGQILPRELLEAPRFGCINVHASLLPKYRGGAPIHHALIRGEKEVGVTIMYMVEALDAGDMLLQRAIPVTESDDVGTLHDRLSVLGAELLTEVLPDILSGKAQARPQDPEQVTYAPNIKREDEKIDWTKGGRALFNQVRGLRPWPVAFTSWKGKPLKIWRAHPLEASVMAEPGTVIRVDSAGIVVATGEGALVLTELQPAGKKAMSVEEFLRGRNMEPGERLGDG